MRTATFAFPLALFVSCPDAPSDEDSSTSLGSESATPTTGCEPQPGALWGPCTADKRCDGDETGLFGCMYVPDPNAPQGSLCAPLCVDDVCEQAAEANVCGELQGSPACEITGACALVCVDDNDCGAGLACFGTRCLWAS